MSDMLKFNNKEKTAMKIGISVLNFISRLYLDWFLDLIGFRIKLEMLLDLFVCLVACLLFSYFVALIFWFANLLIDFSENKRIKRKTVQVFSFVLLPVVRSVDSISKIVSYQTRITNFYMYLLTNYLFLKFIIFRILFLILF